MSRLLSPYDLNPLGYNPLRKILVRMHRFRTARALADQAVRHRHQRAHRPRADVPQRRDHSRVLLASACLPTMFHAIEIDGEPYWDGGYAGNPTITPLIRESDAQDTILVPINPRERPDTPRTAAEILNRLNEISFNSPLMKELRMIALLRQVADPGSGEGARWAKMRVHRVRHRHAGAVRRLLEAQCRMGVRLHAARRGPPAARGVSGRARRRISASARPLDLDVLLERSAEHGASRHPRRRSRC